MRAVAAIASEPLDAWTAFRERYLEPRERPIPFDLYQVEDGWERRLHELLGFPWPCPATSEFWGLWPNVIGELTAKGVRVGPESFKGWNDGDAGLVRAWSQGPQPGARLSLASSSRAASIARWNVG